MNSKTFKILLWVGVLSSQFGFLADGARGADLKCKANPEAFILYKLRDTKLKQDLVLINEKEIETFDLKSKPGICIKCYSDGIASKLNPTPVKSCIHYEIAARSVSITPTTTTTTKLVKNAESGICKTDLTNYPPMLSDAYVSTLRILKIYEVIQGKGDSSGQMNSTDKGDGIDCLKPEQTNRIGTKSKDCPALQKGYWQLLDEHLSKLCTGKSLRRDESPPAPAGAPAGASIGN